MNKVHDAPSPARVTRISSGTSPNRAYGLWREGDQFDSPVVEVTIAGIGGARGAGLVNAIEKVMNGALVVDADDMAALREWLQSQEQRTTYAERDYVRYMLTKVPA